MDAPAVMYKGAPEAHGVTTGSLIMAIAAVVFVFASLVFTTESRANTSDEVKEKERQAVESAAVNPLFLLTVAGVIMLLLRKH